MSARLSEGTVIGGKLRVVRVLGAGGMAAVYEVEHLLTRHRRALKLLLPEMLKHPSVVARFLREASAAGHIGNPHVVETFDAGTLEGGEPYIVMEMLVGEPLGERFQRIRRLPLAELADLVAQAATGVEAAHAAGIVHRDLKPDNLFLVDRGGSTFVKVLDFGISKFDPELTGGPGMTNEGATIGTPYYMAPEQVAGKKDLDARADVYALGVILYEGAAGVRPFEAEALPALSVMIHHGTTTPLGELRPDLPPAFLDVVARAMATDRDARFATARELATALEPFRASALDATIPDAIGASPASPTGPPRAIVRGSSSRPPPATPEERLGTGTLASHGSTPPRASSEVPAPIDPNNQSFGAARSVADEATEPPRRSPFGTLAAVVAAAAIIALGYRALAPSRDTTVSPTPFPGASTDPAPRNVAPPPPPPSSLAPPADSPRLPAPPVAVSATTRPLVLPASAPVPAPSVTAPAKPAASASAKPASSTRADQKGLVGDNPYQ